MSVVSTEKLWEDLRREKAEAEQHFLSFPPFTMDPKEGLFVTVERRRGQKLEEEYILLSARSKSLAVFAIHKVMAGLASCNGRTMTA